MAHPPGANVPTPPVEKNPNEGKSLLARFIWMMGGTVVLVFCLFSVAKGRETFFSAADVVFWCFALLMIAARYADVRHFGGATSSGEPATMRDFAYYALLLPLIGGTAWGLAHVVSHLGWM
jgi:hypothetical protein